MICCFSAKPVIQNMVLLLFVMCMFSRHCLNLQVDGIVNSTNRQLQLEIGHVSKSLLDIGGQTLQNECQQKAPHGVRSGEVVVTSGGKLSCKFVIHGVCCRWDGGNGGSEQVMLTTMISSIYLVFLLMLHSSLCITLLTTRLKLKPSSKTNCS